METLGEPERERVEGVIAGALGSMYIGESLISTRDMTMMLFLGGTDTVCGRADI